MNKSFVLSFLLLSHLTISGAQAEEMGIQCSYKLFNSGNGKQVSNGTFAIRTKHINPVKIENNVSPLDSFNLSVEEHFQAGQDSSNTTYMLQGEPVSKTKKPYFTLSPSDEYVEFFVEDMSVWGIHFGDKKVNGVITMEKPQSYYFMNAKELILLRDSIEPDFYKEILSKDDSCAGGNLAHAANYIRRHTIYYSHDNVVSLENIVQDKDSIEWTEVIKKCAVLSEETHEMGGQLCAQWEVVSQRQVVLPKCAD